VFGTTDRGEASIVFVQGGEAVARLGGRTSSLGALDAADPFAGNVLGACAAALLAGAAPETIADALPRFRGVPFRHRLVAEVNGVRAYNDGMASTPVKARAGLGTYPGRIVWIAGGRVRFPGEVLHDSAAAREQLRELACAARERVCAVVLFGEAAPVLRDVLAERGFAGLVEETDDLASATRRGAELARPGDSLVLAPVYSIPLEEREAFERLAVAALRRREAA
jgi:UDP-N-acetylmuramoylalanine--D-glutamate ligase